jgi:hypothetical protein
MLPGAPASVVLSPPATPGPACLLAAPPATALQNTVLGVVSNETELAAWKAEAQLRVGEGAFPAPPYGLDITFPEVLVVKMWPMYLLMFPPKAGSVVTEDNIDGPMTTQLGNRLFEHVPGIPMEEVVYFQKQFRKIYESINVFRKAWSPNPDKALEIRKWCDSNWSDLVVPTDKKMMGALIRSAKAEGLHNVAQHLEGLLGASSLGFSCYHRAGVRKVLEKEPPQRGGGARVFGRERTPTMSCRFCHAKVAMLPGKSRMQCYAEHNKTCKK